MLEQNLRREQAFRSRCAISKPPGKRLQREPSRLKMSIQRRLTEQMTHAQALKLRSLSQEAYQPKLYDKNLSQAEAARRIEVLQQEIALADSF
jgi:hypothetical protein